MNNIILIRLATAGISSFSLLAFSSAVQAQIRGSGPQQFFDQGTIQLEQQIQQLQKPETATTGTPAPTLEIKEPPEPSVEDVNSPPAGMEDNLPTQPPIDEIQIKF